MDLSNENIVHTKGKELEYIQFKRLLEFPELVHCYTLSTNQFDVAGNDTLENNKESVLSNYKKLSNELKIDYNKIIRPYQTHTDVVENVNEEVEEIQVFHKSYWNVDGLLTNKPNIVFSLGYADCIPIFLYDPIKKVIGNIHSGWKGTLKQIAKKAVSKMIRDYGCNAKDIICAIGPSIRKCHFEVDREVCSMFYKEFLDTDRIHDIISNGNEEGKYFIDTVLINKIILKQVGLSEDNIIDSNICTVCNSDIMHSFRVKHEQAGRNTAIIGLRKDL